MFIYNLKLDASLKGGCMPVLISTKTFPVVLDYDEPLERKILGVLSCIDPDINSNNFPHGLSGQRTTEIILVNLGKESDSENALKELEEMGLRPAIPSELADSFRNNRNAPEFAKSFFIVALGKPWFCSFVVNLYGDELFKGLRLVYFQGIWPEDCWFLAFSKKIIVLPAQ